MCPLHGRINKLDPQPPPFRWSRQGAILRCQKPVLWKVIEPLQLEVRLNGWSDRDAGGTVRRVMPWGRWWCMSQVTRCHMARATCRQTYKGQKPLSDASNQTKGGTGAKLTGHMSQCSTTNIWYARHQRVRNARASGEKHVLRRHPPIPENLDLGTPNLAHWHYWTRALRCCTNRRAGVHGARAVHVQTFWCCTLCHICGQGG